MQNCIGQSEPGWTYRPFVCRELAALWYANSDYPQAIASAQQALALKPDFISAHLILVDALIASGRRQNATKTLETAMRSKPNAVALQRRYRQLMTGVANNMSNTTVARDTEKMPPHQSSVRAQQTPAITPKITLQHPNRERTRANQTMNRSDAGIDEHKPVSQALPQTTPPNISTNPYCRFCPVE